MADNLRSMQESKRPRAGAATPAGAPSTTAAKEKKYLVLLAMVVLFGRLNIGDYLLRANRVLVRVNCQSVLSAETNFSRDPFGRLRDRSPGIRGESSGAEGILTFSFT